MYCSDPNNTTNNKFKLWNANISIQLTIGSDTLKIEYVIKPINLLSCI